MAVGIAIDFNARRTGRYFLRLRRRFPKETKREISRAADDAKREAKRLADGPVLNRRSSRLFNSIRKTTSGSGSRYEFSVGTNATDRGRPYPRFQELGFIHNWSGRRVGPNVIWRRVWKLMEKRLDTRLRRLMERLLR